MGDVIIMGGATKLDIPPDRVLEGAIDKLDVAIVIGYEKGGEEYFASSVTDAETIVWLIERMKHRLMRNQDV